MQMPCLAPSSTRPPSRWWPSLPLACGGQQPSPHPCTPARISSLRTFSNNCCQLPDTPSNPALRSSAGIGRLSFIHTRQNSLNLGSLPAVSLASRMAWMHSALTSCWLHSCTSRLALGSQMKILCLARLRQRNSNSPQDPCLRACGYARLSCKAPCKVQYSFCLTYVSLSLPN